ncbi:MAG: serine esterase [Methylotenera sp.]|nr:serine esterase [Oligoflexia bacterium]
MENPVGAPHVNALESLWQPSPVSGSPWLMVVLHGRGDSVEGFQDWQKSLGIPELSFLLLNAPNPYGPGFSWYDLPPNQLPGILNSSAKLARVFEQLEASGVDLSRTFLFGFSQGCLMTLEFGARYSNRLAGYIGVSGYCHDPKALLEEANQEVIHNTVQGASHGADWLITHGTIDEMLPVERTRAQMKELQDGGFKLEYQEFLKGHFIEPRKELPIIRKFVQDRIS